MLMPKDNRKAIYEYLIEKGVIVAKKDFTCSHPHVKEIPNLHVIKALQSLKSRGYVKEQFAWRHYYWYLTNEGIQYLRDYLHLSPSANPETLRKVDPARRAASSGGPGRSEGSRGPPRPAGEGGYPSRGFGFRGRGAYSHVA